MFFPEKWTASRGRSEVPRTRFRMRWWRSFTALAEAILLNGFTFLADDLFARVTNALALVWLGRVVAADVRRDLADDFLVDPFDLDLRVFRDGYLDVRRDGEKDGVREAEAQVKVLSLHGGLETDALDFQILGETVGDAADHVRDEAAGEAVQGFHLPDFVLALDLDLVVVDAGLYPLRQGPTQFPLRPFDVDFPLARDGELHLRRQVDDFVSYPGHNAYQTKASSSPPTFCFLAWRPVSNPFGVERMEMPMPPRTRGTSVAPT